jgi:2-aminoethylphosphonate-pyruvate transaminase
MIIFSPGPANISERVRSALTLPDICHRDTEFSELLAEVKALMAKALGIEKKPYEIVILSGSGTLAIESLLTCLTSWNKTLLIISNGVYGERAIEICRTYRVKIKEYKLNWGQPLDLAEVEKELKNTEIGGIYIVHHETTTGLLNPLKEIATLAKKYKKLILTDTISSIGGGEELDFGWGIDAALGSSNKCFRGVPGVAFIILSEASLNIAKQRERRSYYSDLITNLDKEMKDETLFTPPVHSLFAFREALKETLDEGIENRISRYNQISRSLRAGLKKLGLKLYLPEELYSNTMTSVYLPEGFTFQELHDTIKKKGFIIYDAQGSLKGKLFMLGVVGVITEQNIKDFLTVLGEVLNKKR